jgi:hypothetical protein
MTNDLAALERCTVIAAKRVTAAQGTAIRLRLVDAPGSCSLQRSGVLRSGRRLGRLMSQPRVDPVPPEMRRLPRPPVQRRDLVNDLGWLSRGLAKKADAQAQPTIESWLLAEGEDSGLPPDPVEPPPLPPPPARRPDTETKGSIPTSERR